MYHEHEVVRLTPASRIPQVRATDVELGVGTVVVLMATLLLHQSTAVMPTPGAGRLGPLLVVLAAAASLVRARFGEGRTQRAVTFDATGVVLMGAALLLTPEWFPLVALAASLRADVWRTVLNTCVRTTAVCVAALSYQSLAWLSSTPITSDAAEATRLIVAGAALIGVELMLYGRHLRRGDRELDLPEGLFRAAILRDAPAVSIGCLAAVLLALAPATTVLLLPVVGLLLRSLRDHERLLEARRDPKTSLLTYAGFRPQAAAEVARAHRHGRPASLLFLDLDGLKSVNMAMGWLVGESVITSLGRVLREQMRAEDVVARTGGDEFCLMLPDTDVSGALAFADRLRAAIETTPLADGTPPLHRTASIGLATLRSGESLDSLLERADEGLRRAKREGRNCVVVMEPVVVQDERDGLAGTAG